jgi:hypothetical protein
MSSRVISIKEFSGFAFDNPSILGALYRRQGEVFSEADLRVLAAAHADDKNTPEHIVRRLIDFRLVEEVDLNSGTYRYARALIDLHRHLENHGEPVSAESIEGNLSSLAQAGSELAMACTQLNHGKAHTAATEIRRLCDDVLRGVTQNFRYVINESLEIKKGDIHLSLRERHDRLRHAWDRYIDPLVQIVNVRGEFAARVQAVEVALLQAENCALLTDTEEVRMLRRLLASVTATANRVMADCLKTVQPLLQRLHADGLVMQGAALGMAQFLKNGAVASGLPGLINVVSERKQDLYRDDELKDVLVALVSFHPTPPAPLPQPAELDTYEPADDYIMFLDETVALLRQMKQVPDLLAFVQEQNPQRSAHHFIRLYHRLGAEDSDFPVNFFGRQTYVLADCELDAPQMAIGHVSGLPPTS